MIELLFFLFAILTRDFFTYSSYLSQYIHHALFVPAIHNFFIFSTPCFVYNHIGLLCYCIRQSQK